MSAVLQGDNVDQDLSYARVVSVLNRRADQQDAAVVSDWLCAIADGLGGHDSGADASRTALSVLEAVVDGPRDGAALLADVALANEAVSAMATSRWRSPGTTLVTVTVDAGFDSVAVAWCGDSRAWLIVGDAVELITEDHSHTYGGGLTRCLGAEGPGLSAIPSITSVPAVRA
jgi:serine/threonine protein phosphatase PrpC